MLRRPGLAERSRATPRPLPLDASSDELSFSPLGPSGCHRTWLGLGPWRPASSSPPLLVKCALPGLHPQTLWGWKEQQGGAGTLHRRSCLSPARTLVCACVSLRWEQMLPPRELHFSKRRKCTRRVRAPVNLLHNFHSDSAAALQGWGERFCLIHRSEFRTR